MTFPTFKYATDTNPGTSAIYGAPDIVYAFHVIDGSHATDRIPIAAIEGTAVALSGTQVISGAKQFNNTSMEFNSPTTNKQYIVNTSDITSNRNITLPLLVADDTFVFANFTQTLTNKTLSGSQNTFSSIPASAITNTAAVLSAANTFVALQTISPTTTNAITINFPTAPTGSSSVFYGGIKTSQSTIAFATTAQTNDYYTNYFDAAVLTNPSSGTIPNAATLKIVGAPIASTNVTITNNYALWVAGGNSLFGGTLTSTGGITMSSADITLAGNKIKTTNYNFYDTTVSNEFGASKNTLLLQQSNTNADSAFVVASNGSGKSPLIGVSRIGSDLITNYEILQITGDQNVVGEFAINVSKGGTGTLRPLNIYMSATKLMSFDIANTIHLAVDTYFEGKINQNANANANSDNLNIQDEFGISNIGNFYTQLTQNLYYNIGWKSRQGGSGCMIEMDGGSSQTQTMQFLIGDGSTSTTLGSAINLTTMLALGTSGVTVFKGINTSALGLAPIYGSTSQKSETGADANVLTYTPPATAGTYRVRIAISVSAASAATLGVTATWKDSNGHAQAPTNLALTKGGTAAPALTFSAAANDVYYTDFQIEVDNSATAIVVKTTFTGTSIAYKISASIEQIQ